MGTASPIKFRYSPGLYQPLGNAKDQDPRALGLTDGVARALVDPYCLELVGRLDGEAVASLAGAVLHEGLGHAVWGSKPAVRLERREGAAFASLQAFADEHDLAPRHNYHLFTAGLDEEGGYLVSVDKLAAAAQAQHHYLCGELMLEPLALDHTELTRDYLIPFIQEELDSDGLDNYPVLAAIVLGLGKAYGEAAELARGRYGEHPYNQQIEQDMRAAREHYLARANACIPLPAVPPFVKYAIPASVQLVQAYFEDSIGMHQLFCALAARYQSMFDSVDDAMERILVAALLSEIFQFD